MESVEGVVSWSIKEKKGGYYLTVIEILATKKLV